MFGTSPIELLATDAMLRGEIFCNEFFYNADFLTGTNQAIGANGTPNQTVQITSEADFVCQRLVATCWGSAAGALLQDPDFTVNITIATGRPWFNAPLVLRNVCGTYAAAEKPTPMTMPRLIPLSSSLTVAIVNRTATAANFLQIVFEGFNVYYQQNSDGSPVTRSQVFHAL